MNYNGQGGTQNSNYMHMRTKNDRSYASLEADRMKQVMQQQSANHNKLGLTYNSTSIPYMKNSGAPPNGYQGAPNQGGQRAQPLGFNGNGQQPGGNRRAGDNLFNLNQSFGQYSRHSGVNRPMQGYNSNQQHYQK
jgi:hypothetical protein